MWHKTKVLCLCRDSITTLCISIDVAFTELIHTPYILPPLPLITAISLQDSYQLLSVHNILSNPSPWKNWNIKFSSHTFYIPWLSQDLYVMNLRVSIRAISNCCPITKLSAHVMFKSLSLSWLHDIYSFKWLTLSPSYKISAIDPMEQLDQWEWVGKVAVVIWWVQASSFISDFEFTGLPKTLSFMILVVINFCKL